MKKLNLGCGMDIKNGWINVDCVKNMGVDKVFDLNQFPYPFKENQFDLILLNAILEHLDNPEKVIEEIWRISKHSAKIFISVPHFSCWQTWGDITHKRAFNSTSLFPFSIKKSHRSSSSLINQKKELFEIGTKITLGKFKKFFGFEFLINLNNASRGFYERNFAYIFPAESIKWKLKTTKNEKI